MDPFNLIPSELQIEIIVHVQSKRTTMNLITASPTMLQAHKSHKFCILNRRVAADFEEFMIQDAMLIILFPGKLELVSSSSSTKNYGTVKGLLAAWKKQQLPNPLRTGDKTLCEHLHQLHSRLLFYIEDYVTKSTAAYPPREYLCLPDSSGYLTFKGKRICKRFDAQSLSAAERKLFFRSFLRYELLHKICRRGDDPRLLKRRPRGKELGEYAGLQFQGFEISCLSCIEVYEESLISALAANGGDFWLPDVPQGSLSITDLLPPDNIHVDLRTYTPYQTMQVVNGLDVTMSLIQATLSECPGQEFKEGACQVLLASFAKRRSSSSWDVFIAILEGDRDITNDRAPDLYKTLRSRDLSSPMRRTYEQRAWAFLDDDRLFPKDAPIPLLPTVEEFDEQHAKAAAMEDWFTNPALARALRRSQTWHDEQDLCDKDRCGPGVQRGSKELA